ncbi:DUF86 domain-containing protein [Synechococcus sp. PCC 7336]|uniref:HepT-like ribonuclease domain-containing protein n=1 Tax=Synechococcus sp. PCC 7336 TaxID=195250 RepID=UPI00034933CC|nr:DUF86 domain-containing protein [Synechococcus sp. PCC 7336]
MSRNLTLYLDDILTSIAKIDRYTANATRESLTSDELTFDAVMYNLQIIGEAVKNIPIDIRDRYPQIEWRKIAGLRDIVARAYFSIDDEIIWDVICNKLPDLHRQVENLKSELPQSKSVDAQLGRSQCI